MSVTDFPRFGKQGVDRKPVRSWLSVRLAANKDSIDTAGKLTLLAVLWFTLLFAGLRIINWPHKAALDRIEIRLDREIEELYRYRDTLNLTISSHSHTLLLLKQNARLGLGLHPTLESLTLPEAERLLDRQTAQQPATALPSPP